MHFPPFECGEECLGEQKGADNVCGIVLLQSVLVQLPGVHHAPSVVHLKPICYNFHLDNNLLRFTINIVEYE